MLADLSIENFRCIRAAELSFDAHATQISGPNASGKTSALEAIFFLAHGRSFRTSLRAELVRNSEQQLRVVASGECGSSGFSAGIEFGNGETRLHLSRENVAIWKVAKILPVQVIDPSIHRLIEEGSARRRRLVDWGVFHVKPQFLSSWREYQRALMQRNVLLQANAADSELKAWNEMLVERVPAVHSARYGYVEELRPIFEILASELTDELVTLRYRAGWNTDQTFSEALESSRVRERKQRTTTVGPHRADIEIILVGSLAKKRISRGQQKLIAAALVLAQIQHRATLDTNPTCLLLDDPAAELDVDNLRKLLRVVARIPAQIVFTSLQKERLSGIETGRAFHVEQGRFRQVL